MLIVKDNPKSPISESYRTLRTNIQFSSFDDNMSTILITSSTPSEGKSTVSSNLALAMAETNKKVLLIDCDLRRPSVHKKFGLSNEKGLSNLLIGQHSFNEIAQEVTENLSVLTSGTIPPNPSEMLSSKKMELFLSEAKKNFDFIILDTPPVVSVTDAQALSTVADGVLLVVASGQAQIPEVHKAIELLQYVKANIIGIVANKVKSVRRGYKYYQYYYYGEGDEKKKKHRSKSSK